VLVPDEKVAPLGIDEGRGLIRDFGDCRLWTRVLGGQTPLVFWTAKMRAQKTKGFDGSGVIPGLGDKGLGSLRESAIWTISSAVNLRNVSKSGRG
jgi:hypothetical protein